METLTAEAIVPAAYVPVNAHCERAAGCS